MCARACVRNRRLPRRRYLFVLSLSSSHRISESARVPNKHRCAVLRATSSSPPLPQLPRLHSHGLLSILWNLLLCLAPGTVFNSTGACGSSPLQTGRRAAGSRFQSVSVSLLSSFVCHYSSGISWAGCGVRSLRRRFNTRCPSCRWVAPPPPACTS